MEARIEDIVKQVLTEVGKAVAAPTVFEEKEPFVFTGNETGIAAVSDETQHFSLQR